MIPAGRFEIAPAGDNVRPAELLQPTPAQSNRFMNMLNSTDDVHIRELKTLIPPAVLMEEFPLDAESGRVIAAARGAIEKAFAGEDDRLVVVVGPCSIHDPAAALEYADRLLACREQYADDLLIVIARVFRKAADDCRLERPDQRSENRWQLRYQLDGLRVARGLLLELAQKRVPAGCEFLDTISPQFIADLVAWGAIGARTTESQVHPRTGIRPVDAGRLQMAPTGIEGSRSMQSLLPQNRIIFSSVNKQGLSAIVSTEGNRYST